MDDTVRVYFGSSTGRSVLETLRATVATQSLLIVVDSLAVQTMLQKQLPILGEAGSPLKFGPEEGPEFFTASGWKPVEVYSMLKTAAKIKRLPFGPLRLVALLPESNGRQGSRPWGGVCRLARI